MTVLNRDSNKPRILIADESEKNRGVLRKFRKDDYAILEAVTEEKPQN